MEQSKGDTRSQARDRGSRDAGIVDSIGQDRQASASTLYNQAYVDQLREPLRYNELPPPFQCSSTVRMDGFGLLDQYSPARREDKFGPPPQHSLATRKNGCNPPLKSQTRRAEQSGSPGQNNQTTRTNGFGPPLQSQARRADPLEHAIQHSPAMRGDQASYLHHNSQPMRKDPNKYFEPTKHAVSAKRAKKISDDPPPEGALIDLRALAEALRRMTGSYKENDRDMVITSIQILEDELDSKNEQIAFFEDLFGYPIEYLMRIKESLKKYDGQDFRGVKILRGEALQKQLKSETGKEYSLEQLGHVTEERLDEKYDCVITVTKRAKDEMDLLQKIAEAEREAEQARRKYNETFAKQSNSQKINRSEFSQAGRSKSLIFDASFNRPFNVLFDRPCDEPSRGPANPAMFNNSGMSNSSLNSSDGWSTSLHRPSVPGPLIRRPQNPIMFTHDEQKEMNRKARDADKEKKRLEQKAAKEQARAEREEAKEKERVEREAAKEQKRLEREVANEAKAKGKGKASEATTKNVRANSRTQTGAHSRAESRASSFSVGETLNALANAAHKSSGVYYMKSPESLIVKIPLPIDQLIALNMRPVPKTTLGKRKRTVIVSSDSFSSVSVSDSESDSKDEGPVKRGRKAVKTEEQSESESPVKAEEDSDDDGPVKRGRKPAKVEVDSENDAEEKSEDDSEESTMELEE